MLSRRKTTTLKVHHLDLWIYRWIKGTNNFDLVYRKYKVFPYVDSFCRWLPLVLFVDWILVLGPTSFTGDFKLEAFWSVHIYFFRTKVSFVRPAVFAAMFSTALGLVVQKLWLALGRCGNYTAFVSPCWASSPRAHLVPGLWLCWFAGALLLQMSGGDWECVHGRWLPLSRWPLFSPVVPLREHQRPSAAPPPPAPGKLPCPW